MSRMTLHAPMLRIVIGIPTCLHPGGERAIGGEGGGTPAFPLPPYVRGRVPESLSR